MMTSGFPNLRSSAVISSSAPAAAVCRLETAASACPHLSSPDPGCVFKAGEKLLCIWKATRYLSHFSGDPSNIGRSYINFGSFVRMTYAGWAAAPVFQCDGSAGHGAGAEYVGAAADDHTFVRMDSATEQRYDVCLAARPLLEMEAEWSVPPHCAPRAAGAAGYSEYARPRRGRPGVRQRGGWRRQSTCGGGAWRGVGSEGGVVPPPSEQEAQNSRGGPPRRRHPHRLSGAQFTHMHVSSNNTQDYMEQMTVQAVDSIRPYSDNPMSLAPSDYCQQSSSGSASAEYVGEAHTAVSQYVTALKNAGLPTDVPIVFETGDGSYVNVDEQVLLDMVQSNEMQYEVIERPVCLESSVDPAHVKSIDDLSRRLRRPGDQHAFTCEDAGGLSAILPDSAEPYSLPEPEPSPRTAEKSIDFNEGDLFAGEALTDEVKKYYEEHFNMSLLPGESGLRKNDCFDFELPHGGFKTDALDCLMAADAPAGAAVDGGDRFDDSIESNNEKRSGDAERPPPNDEKSGLNSRTPEIKIEVTRENGELVENAAESPEIKENQSTDDTGNSEHKEDCSTYRVDETDSKLEDLQQNSIENAGKAPIEPEKSTETIQAAGQMKIIEEMDDETAAGEATDIVNLTEDDYDDEEKENSERSAVVDTNDIPYAVGLRSRTSLRERRQSERRVALAELDVLIDTRCFRRKVRKKI